jgi:hypothetical protein
MNDNNVTLKQIQNMKHCIGFRGDRVKRKKYVTFRNYYTTSDNSQSWDELVNLELATKMPFPNGGGDNPQCYFVSRKGMDLLESLLECKIVEDEA